jgi:hypothetical protein
MIEVPGERQHLPPEELLPPAAALDGRTRPGERIEHAMDGIGKRGEVPRHAVEQGQRESLVQQDRQRAVV